MRLWRAIGTGLMLIVMAGVLGLLAVIFEVKFDNTTPVGKSLKRNFLRYPQLVRAVNLNEPGDARYLYADPDKETLEVRVFQEEGVAADAEAMGWLEEMIWVSIGKRAEVSMEPEELNTAELGWWDSDLNRIRKEIGADGFEGVNIVYLSEYAEVPTYAGMTLHRDTIFVFLDRIKELAGSQQSIKRLEKSTIMHEWGHLLGIEHVDLPECVMAAEVEVVEYAGGGELIHEYCDYELYQMEQLRTQAQDYSRK